MTSICFSEGIKEGIRQESIALEWGARGFNCEMWVDPPDQVWENYVHDADELIMPVTGMLEVEVAGQARRLRAGDELLIPARALHSVRNIGHTSACWLYGYRQVA